MELQPKSVGRRYHYTRIGLGNSGIGRVNKQGYDGRRRDQFVQHSSRFGAISLFNWVTPVTLPPGRLRLATSPILTGSEPASKTIGMVAVAAFAASAARVGARQLRQLRDEPDRPPSPVADRFGPPPSGIPS